MAHMPRQHCCRGMWKKILGIEFLTYEYEIRLELDFSQILVGMSKLLAKHCQSIVPLEKRDHL